VNYPFKTDLGFTNNRLNSGNWKEQQLSERWQSFYIWHNTTHYDSC